MRSKTARSFSCQPERTGEPATAGLQGSSIERSVTQILRGLPLRMTFIAVALAALSGCHSPRKGEPLAKDLAGSDPDAQVNFWHALTDKPVTSNDEAFHGLLL